MDLATLLLQPSDLPSWHAASEFKVLTGDDPILRNVGGATTLAIRWIGTVENRAEFSGEIRLYLYPSESSAEQFFLRLTRDFDGDPLANIGDRALIKHSDHGSFQTTAIRFLRRRAVAQMHGISGTPPFARSTLTFTSDALVRYAERLDQRLLSTEYSGG